MKFVYASRTGNVESIVERLGLSDPLKIETGSEDFLNDNGSLLKGVIVSGDLGYGEAYCQAGDTISEQYQVPCLYKVENEGTDEDIVKMTEIINKL